MARRSLVEEAEPSYEWDYHEDDHAPAPRVLWGRVAALVFVLILAFLLGRASAGGADEGELKRLRTQVAEQQDQIEDLEDQLAIDELAAPVESPAAEAQEAETGETESGETYVVKKGDNLALLAERFYDDVTLDECLAAVNGISDPQALRAGQKIVVPADCSPPRPR